MTKIAIITNEFLPYPGGIGRYCAELASAATTQGCDVTVFAPNYYGDNADDQQEKYRIKRFDGGVFNFTPTELVYLTIQLRAFLLNDKFDIVHAADWPMIISLGFIPRRNEDRIVTIYGSDAGTLYLRRKARLSLSRSAMMKFSRYVAISAFSGGILREFFPKISPKDVVIAPLGVNDYWFSKPSFKDIQQFKTRLHGVSADFLLITVARIEDRKGQIEVIDAISMLPRELRQRILYVNIGRAVNASLLKKMENNAKRAGVNFKFLGRIPDSELRAAYSIADLFVLAAQNKSEDVEGFGLVLLEAAAQGLPSLVTPVHAIPEVVLNGETGWISQNAEPNSVAKALESVCQQNLSAQNLADRCILHARSFTWSKCVSATYAL